MMFSKYVVGGMVPVSAFERRYLRNKDFETGSKNWPETIHSDTSVQKTSARTHWPCRRDSGGGTDTPNQNEKQQRARDEQETYRTHNIIRD